MGLFQQRPEEPTEWGGLPSEPWEPREPSEVLPADAAAFELPLFGEIPRRETVSYTAESWAVPEVDPTGAAAADDAD